MPICIQFNLLSSRRFIDILVITVCGFICGADNYTELVQWARQHEEWLKQFLELSNGVPSHDTFGRVFALIDPKEFEKAFHAWVDVALNEDRSTVRMKNAAQNVAIVRRLALNLLRQVQSGKISNQVKRKKAAWDINFLLKILAGGEI